MKSKPCSKCGEVKKLKDYYCYHGSYRSACKLCIVKQVMTRQRAEKTWRNRVIDKEAQRAYMQTYYANHPEKFKKYRETFLKKHPDYYRTYQQKRPGELTPDPN